jgi:ABC-type uncharacterized transport system permease subunit
MNDNMPQNKVIAGLPVAAVAGFLCWLVHEVWGYAIPAEQAITALGISTFLVQYYVRNKAPK